MSEEKEWLFYNKNKTTLNYRHDAERSRRNVVINSIESVARLIGM